MVRAGRYQKEIPVNKLIYRIGSNILMMSLFFSAHIFASENNNICQDKGVVFAYFNGVLNTLADANHAKRYLRKTHGLKTQQGEAIQYEVLYNYTNGMEDFVEVFEQRFQEHATILKGRFELFFEAIRNTQGGWLERANKILDAKNELDKALRDAAEAAAVRALTAGAANPPTEVNYQEHRLRIDSWVLEGKKMMFVAHSQGNLFANPAYNYATGKTSAKSVKVVHVAPASSLLNGDHVLADKDIVINGLRVSGSVPSITDTIPLNRPAGINGKKDALGHGLLEIYLNSQLAISQSVKTKINAALNSLESPPVQAQSGFFTTTLTWNGAGDVDLHTFEPSGTHVYYANKAGVAGYLDVDNTQSFGPEHYYASCKADKLKVGVYRIAVANYDRADGREATVQLASYNNGVLGTKKVTLGSATGDNPAFTLFNVSVTKNEETGKYSATLQ